MTEEQPELTPDQIVEQAKNLATQRLLHVAGLAAIYAKETNDPRLQAVASAAAQQVTTSGGVQEMLAMFVKMGQQADAGNVSVEDMRSQSTQTFTRQIAEARTQQMKQMSARSEALQKAYEATAAVMANLTTQQPKPEA